MRQATMQEARSKLSHLIRQAEKGQAVRLTRYGKPVAVVISHREYQRMVTDQHSRHDFMRFLQSWRREMIAKGLPFASNVELDSR